MKTIYIILLAISTLLLVGCVTETGFSKDTIYGYDKGMSYYHLYLTNDHTTTYCIRSQDKDLVKTLEIADSENKVIRVEYQNIGLGSCVGGTGAHDSVVRVTDITIVN